MKIVVGVVALLLLLVAALAAFGALQPVSHAAARKARFRQAPATIYDAITRVEELPTWRKGMKSVEELPARDGKRCYREHTRDGPILFVVDVSEPVHRVVTRIADPELPFGGTWTFRIEPVESGSELTITEHGEITNVFYRALARLVFGYTANMQLYLESLAAKFGESVTIEPAPPDARE